MKLYVCWGTFPIPWPGRETSWKPRFHACKVANDALREAGHKPKVKRVFGYKSLPDFTRGRREVKRLTGESTVPLLVLDGGEFVQGSQEIAAWARQHPASG
jgi:hypothetical protein